MGATAVTSAGPEDAQAASDRLLAGPGAIWVVHGPAGSGRSTVLSGQAQRGRRSGAAVLQVPACPAPETVLLRLTTQLVELITALDRPELVSMLSAVAWLRARLESGSGAGPQTTAHDLITVLATLAPRGRIVLQFDDFDLLPPELATVLTLVAEGARAAGTVTVATVTGREPAGGPVGKLLAIADGTIGLRPLTATETTALLPGWTTRAGRIASDPALVTAVRTALGPLFGNPGTVGVTIAGLRATGRLSVIDEHVCLTGAGIPILLPDGHPETLRLRRLGPLARRLAAIVAVLSEQSAPTLERLPWLASAAALTPSATGQALDDLVRAGILRTGTDGAVEFAVPALADRLRLEHGTRWRTVLHRRIVRSLLGRQPVDPAEIAPHLAGLPPSPPDPETASLVLAAAAGAGTDLPTARRYRLAALRLLDPSEDRFPEVLRALLSDSLAAGGYGTLADDLAIVVVPRLAGAWPHPRLSATVLLCWLGALAHEQRLAELDVVRPLAAEVARALGTGRDCRRLLDAVNRADRPVAAEAVRVLARACGAEDDHLFALGAGILLGALPGDGGRPAEEWLVPPERPPHEDVAEAAEVLDTVSVLNVLLRGRYQPPTTGFSVGWHAIRQAYREGEWDTALSLARRIEGDRLWWDPPRRHRFASVFAAEICAQRDRPDRAADWLRRLPFRTPADGYVAWVRCRLRQSEGRHEEAVAQGLRDYTDCRERGVRAGMERLLARLLHGARQLEDTETMTRLLAELESLAARTPTASVQEAALVCGGLVRGDLESVRAGVKLARQSGDAFRIAQACTAFGEVSPVPAPSLLEAHRTLQRLDAVAALSYVSDLLDRHRIPFSPDRVDRAGRAPLDPLERHIVGLIASGHTNRQIAAALQVSEKRIEARLTSLFERTGSHSRVELAAAWLQGRLGRVS
ncbi:helix-turn-helix transcriptional regulator [Amycolatopsis alba]|uniref:LuxR family transcriptional regulator n=1 Tax=Amycolatopsis alba DSM 44262 TaxID=1125972 RepID=A0A229RSY1_AMYAL|nr:LuxR C-terminal-related transcriptional regulator [Amycolatopsis alba]OXM49504.1 LuxR family transcriptional regulator [Amycolatopsis alba DSM 44262]